METPEPVHAAEFFILRTPLLPFDEWLAFGEGLAAPAALGDPARLEEAVARDRARLRDRLRALAERPEVREALFVASPSFEESLNAWLAGPDTERGLKAEHVLVRYFARMAGRATPFGLFAGWSQGRVASGAEGARGRRGSPPPEATRLAVEGRPAYQRHTRLDMNYLFTLAEGLARDPDIRRHLRYRPNSSLYRAAGRLRYARSQPAEPGGRGRSYRLVAAEPSEYLDLALEQSRGGATPAAIAAALLEHDPELGRDEVEAFANELIDGEVLVPDLSPAVTGPEPIHRMIEELGGTSAGVIAPGAHATRVLEEARGALSALDEGSLGAEPERYRAVARSLAGLPAPVELPRLFQVDMSKPAPQAVLGAEVIRELLGGVRLLHRIAAPRPEDALDRFRKAFRERYEAQEVPLVEALDEESGIGFDRSTAPSAEASPLLPGIDLPGAKTFEGAAWGPWEALLLGKLGAALVAREREIELDESDLSALENKDRPPLPDCFAVMASLAAASERAIASGDFRVHIAHVTGPSGARLLGRFCHADQRLEEATRQLLRTEEAHRPEAIYAEIVHLPQGRVGNVILRPVLRDHEIAWIGRSGASRERQIGIDDLWVSVVADRVVLRSRSLGREVIPRMATAHNFQANSLGIYRFLCSLQVQGCAGGLGFRWGALEASPYLPRVVVRRLVLEPARWRLGRPQLDPLSGRGARLFHAASELRAQLDLPRHVTVVDGDNLLPIDLDNILSVETLAHLVKRRSHVDLMETYPPPTELCAAGPEGRFVHELVVPFVRAAAPAPERALRSPSSPRPSEVAARVPRTARCFPPGSEWLYAKLYCGAASADGVLDEVVAPLVESARSSGAADGWFFIRFGDPDWHLRLRLRGDPGRLLGEVLPALTRLAAPLLSDGRIARIQLDTYEREIERYGGPVGIGLAERLFEADSDAVLGILRLYPGDAGADARWRLALRGMDLLLADLAFDTSLRRHVVDRARAGFAREFHADVALERQLGSKYRSERASLEALLSPEPPADHPLSPGCELLARRSQRIAAAATELRSAARSGALEVSLPSLAASYLHMHVNRLLRSAHRAQELVLYDLLSRIYAARTARSTGRAAAPVSMTGSDDV